jgi:hypothetical protein
MAVQEGWWKPLATWSKWELRGEACEGDVGGSEGVDEVEVVVVVVVGQAREIHIGDRHAAGSCTMTVGMGREMGNGKWEKGKGKKGKRKWAKAEGGSIPND